MTGIEVPGFISDSELVHRVANCTALVFPSLQEGFGLPIVEAAFVGTPVITSDRPPMNELAPECSLLVDPESSDEITAAMNELCGDAKLRERLSQATAQVRERFGRRRLADSLRRIYQDAA